MRSPLFGLLALYRRASLLTEITPRERELPDFQISNDRME